MGRGVLAHGPIIVCRDSNSKSSPAPVNNPGEQKKRSQLMACLMSRYIRYGSVGKVWKACQIAKRRIEHNTFLRRGVVFSVKHLVPDEIKQRADILNMG